MGFWSNLLPGSVGVKEISSEPAQRDSIINNAPRAPIPPQPRPGTSAGPMPHASNVQMARQFPAEPDFLPDLSNLHPDEKQTPTKRARGFSLGRRKTKAEKKSKDDLRNSHLQDLGEVPKLNINDVRARSEERKREEMKQAQARANAINPSGHPPLRESQGINEAQRRDAQRQNTTQEEARRNKVDPKKAEEVRRMKSVLDERKSKEKGAPDAVAGAAQKTAGNDKKSRQEAKKADEQRRADEKKAEEQRRMDEKKAEEQRRIDEKKAKEQEKKAEEERQIKAAEDEKKAKAEERIAAEKRRQQAIEDERLARLEARRVEEQRKMDEKEAEEDARKAEEQRKIQEKQDLVKAKEDEKKAKEDERKAKEDASVKAKEDEKKAKEEEKKAKEDEKLRIKEEKKEAKEEKKRIKEDEKRERASSRMSRKSMDDRRSIISESGRKSIDGRRRLQKRPPSSAGSRPPSRQSSDRPRTANRDRDDEPPVPRLSISAPDPPVLPPIAPLLPLLEHERESGSWSDGIVLPSSSEATAPGMAVTTDRTVKVEPLRKPELSPAARHQHRDSDIMSFHRKRSQSAAQPPNPGSSWLLDAPTVPNRLPPAPPPTTYSITTEPPRPRTANASSDPRSSKHFATLSLTAFGPANGQVASSITERSLRNRRSLLDMDNDLPLLFPMPPAPSLVHDGEITPASSSVTTHSRNGSTTDQRGYGAGPESPRMVGGKDAYGRMRGTFGQTFYAGHSQQQQQRSPRMDQQPQFQSMGRKVGPALYLGANGMSTTTTTTTTTSTSMSTSVSGGRGYVVDEGGAEEGTNSFDLLREEQEKEWGKLKRLMEGNQNGRMGAASNLPNGKGPFSREDVRGGGPPAGVKNGSTAGVVAKGAADGGVGATRIRGSDDEEEERLRQFDFANAQALAAFDFGVGS